MKVLGIVILVLIGGFTGLCSAAFTVGVIASPSQYVDLTVVSIFAIPGFLIALACFFGIRALARKPPPKAPGANPPDA